MNQMCRLFIGVFISLFGIQLSAQQLFNTSFRALDGLGTDIIKCVSQDASGFIWIGTDDGLIRYDGHAFTSYPDRLSSRYIKDLLFTQDQRLLIAHDLGLSEVVSTADTTYFISLINGVRNQTDEALWYPKNLYEDERGHVWIAEPQSVVRLLPNGQWNRYHFGPEDNSSNFVRSFQFLSESDTSLLIASFTGNLYRYSYSSERIQSLGEKQQLRNLYILKRIHDRIFAGTGQGLFEVSKSSYATRKVGLPGEVSDLIEDGPDQILVTTEIDKTYRYHLSTNTFEDLNIDVSTNQIFRSSDQTLWLSTISEGVVQLSELQFRPIVNESITGGALYSEALLLQPNTNNLFLLGKEEIWHVDIQEEKSNIWLQSPGYFITGVADENGLWVSNERELWRIENKKVQKRVDFGSYGRYIFTLFRDRSGVFWIGQEAATGLRSFDPASGVIENYSENRGLPVEIAALAEDKQGLYAGTGDGSHLLYFKPIGASKFKAIDIPLPSTDKKLEVSEIAARDGQVWLATNQGIWTYESDSLYKVKFNHPVDKMAIQVLVLDDQHLWFGSSLGLMQYHLDSKELTLFNEQCGLPVNTVNEESISLTGDKIWVGTARGLAVTQATQNKESIASTPQLIQVLVDGKPWNKKKKARWYKIPYRSYLELTFSSLTFPSALIQYSFRIPEMDSSWSKPTFSQSFELIDLPSGPLTVEVRSKKLGTYQWSEPTQYPLFIQAPFYRTPLFFILIILGSAIFLFTGIYSTRRVLTRRNEKLEQQVRERTSELDTYKNGLEEQVRERTNALETTLDRLQNTQSQLIQSEKMASLGVLTAGIAHEIKNPINFLQTGYQGLEQLLERWQKDQEDVKPDEFVPLMKGMQMGLDRVTDIVASLSRFSRKEGTEFSPCNLHEILDNCLLILNHEIKMIGSVEKSYDESVPVSIEGDEGSLHQLLINLIGNAVHALEKDGMIRLHLEIKEGMAVIGIEDNGKGIPKSHLDQLYDPFFTTKPAGVGTGLGLFIARQVVDSHGGTLYIDSEVGRGTYVHISLPLKHIQSPE